MMSKYRITGPDGGTYEVTAPDGASEQEVLAYVQQNVQSRAPLGEPAKTEARPSLFRWDSDFRREAGLKGGHMLVAAGKDMFGNRRGAAEYLAQKSRGAVGGTESAPTVALPDGREYRLNDEGLDSTDVANVAGNVAAFWSPASWAARFNQAKNIGLAGRAATQAGAAGATDIGIQAAANEGDVDPFRTISAAAGAGAGEAIGTGIGAIAQRASRSMRTTPAGGNVPATIADSAIRNADEIAAGTNPAAIAGRDKYGFLYTQGQRAIDDSVKIPLLRKEEVLRQTPGGQELFQAAAKRNDDQLVAAISDTGDRLGGSQGATPGDLAVKATDKIKQQAGELKERIGDAYDVAAKGNRTAVSTDYVATLPDRLLRSVSDFAPNPQTTPVADQTLKQVRNVAKSLKGPESGGVKGITLKAIDTQRRIINNNIEAASNPTDKAAVTAIKREFDQWVDDAVDQALISGDAGALSALKDARRLRAEYGRRFEGGADTDRFIAGMLDGSKTPEELINVALGASSVSKAGGARFIERLKLAADGDPEVVGSLRAAHFMRMAVGKDGNPQKMGDIIRNIRSTKYGNDSVVKALYSPDEWAEVESLAEALGPLVPVGDFAKSSGTTERLFRMLLTKVGGFPMLGPAINTVDSMVGSVRANAALNKPLKLKAQAPAGSQAMGATLVREEVR